MKVLMISGDRNIRVAGSDAHARLELQRSQVDQLDVFVWPGEHSVRTIWRSARAKRYDVITAQDPFWRGLLAWKLARMTGAKLNVQVHADLSGQTCIKRVFARAVVRHADSIRVVSEQIRAQVEDMGVQNPIHILPIFRDLAPFKALVPEPHEQKVVLWIGRFEPEKDPLFALSVFTEIRELGINARFVMLGTGSLEKEVQRLGTNLAVEFPGWQDPKPYLQKADVVLCTSRHESWGASIIEALAAGVPVVAPDVGIARAAGAIVVDRAQLGKKVSEVLRQGARGTLLLHLPTAEEWAKQWRASLV